MGTITYSAVPLLCCSVACFRCAYALVEILPTVHDFRKDQSKTLVTAVPASACPKSPHSRTLFVMPELEQVTASTTTTTGITVTRRTAPIDQSICTQHPNSPCQSVLVAHQELASSVPCSNSPTPVPFVQLTAVLVHLESPQPNSQLQSVEAAPEEITEATPTPKTSDPIRVVTPFDSDEPAIPFTEAAQFLSPVVILDAPVTSAVVTPPPKISPTAAPTQRIRPLREARLKSKPIIDESACSFVSPPPRPKPARTKPKRRRLVHEVDTDDEDEAKGRCENRAVKSSVRLNKQPTEPITRTVEVHIDRPGQVAFRAETKFTLPDHAGNEKARSKKKQSTTKVKPERSTAATVSKEPSKPKSVFDLSVNQTVNMSVLPPTLSDLRQIQMAKKQAIAPDPSPTLQSPKVLRDLTNPNQPAKPLSVSLASHEPTVKKSTINHSQSSHMGRGTLSSPHPAVQP
ncbi:hypothetical protein P879_03681 [Paragonimus westermani]|uniref:Uncharacterized protein n=1 Tax=Paragonimus westermani TaxID=34504 RepID=A0A8T0DUM8_9TREM|nr:hypothetical protein P879_03681 [Paragonimus westermani]